MSSYTVNKRPCSPQSISSLQNDTNFLLNTIEKEENIYKRILFNLEAKDCLALSRVNKAWRQIINEHFAALNNSNSPKIQIQNPVYGKKLASPSIPISEGKPNTDYAKVINRLVDNHKNNANTLRSRFLEVAMKFLSDLALGSKLSELQLNAAIQNLVQEMLDYNLFDTAIELAMTLKNEDFRQEITDLIELNVKQKTKLTVQIANDPSIQHAIPSVSSSIPKPDQKVENIVRKKLFPSSDIPSQGVQGNLFDISSSFLEDPFGNNSSSPVLIGERTTSNPKGLENYINTQYGKENEIPNLEQINKLEKKIRDKDAQITKANQDFYIAVKEKEFEKAKGLIEKSSLNPNLAIAVAALFDDINLLNCITERNKGLTASVEGNLALCFAAENGYEEFANALISNNYANPNDDSHEALILAIENEHTQTALFILQSKNFSFEGDEDIIHSTAIEFGNTAVVQALLKHERFSAEDHVERMFNKSIECSCRDVAALILNYRDFSLEEIETFLFKTIKLQSKPIAKLLLDYKNFPPTKLLEYFQYAVENKAPPMLELLIDHPSFPLDKCDTLLSKILESKNIAASKVILRHQKFRKEVTLSLYFETVFNLGDQDLMNIILES
ncbi:MAG: hypothetical protein K0S74_658 [Chlamydiales bacterium]|jgi:hypothetical protein|nr:hypothetical protein [Chlamydiales bacterium]